MNQEDSGNQTHVLVISVRFELLLFSLRLIVLKIGVNQSRTRIGLYGKIGLKVRACSLETSERLLSFTTKNNNENISRQVKYSNKELSMKDITKN